MSEIVTVENTMKLQNSVHVWKQLLFEIFGYTNKLDLWAGEFVCVLQCAGNKVIYVSKSRSLLHLLK